MDLKYSLYLSDLKKGDVGIISGYDGQSNHSVMLNEVGLRNGAHLRVLGGNNSYMVRVNGSACYGVGKSIAEKLKIDLE